MLFEKAKIVKAAEKYLALGKFSAAIKEYEQLVANDAEDLTALNMLGDLYVRVGSKEEAIACFLRIAEHYREEDFSLKAIAMYKKIDRLHPSDPEIAEKLAVLYGMQGLIVDARAQYLIVADSHTRAGQPRKALEVLRRIADLDPENTDIRIKLAEGYLKEGVTSEAATALVVAGDHLLARGAVDDAVVAYARALEISPDDQTILNGLLTAHVARGTADEAAEILERVVAENPDEAPLLDMLARAYVSAEDAAGAERATAALAAQNSSQYLRFVEVAYLYLKAGDLDAAVNVVARIVEQMLAGREEVALLELVNEALARDREHVQALRLLVRIHWWQRDMEKLRAALERLLEAAQAAALVEDERYALTQLTRLVPDQPRYFERLRELGGAREETPGDQLPDFQTAGDQVPTFESSRIDDQAVDNSGAIVSDPQADAFEWNSVADTPPADPSASFADLDQPRTPLDDPALAASGAETGTAGSDFQEIDFETVVAEELPTDQDREASASDPTRQTVLLQELESVDFYISQGYADIALDTLQLLEQQFGPHADIDARRELLKQLPAPEATGGSAGETQPKLVTDSAGVEKQELASKSPAKAATSPVAEETPSQSTASAKPGSPIDPGLAELMEEFRVAAEDEEPRASEGDFETHYNLGLAYKDMYMQDEAAEEFQVAAGLVRPGDGTARYLQCCNMLGHCFLQKGLPRLAVMWFKKGLESPGHSEDEYQALRYDLGAAYEEMGNLDQAIEVFSEVYGLNVSYRGVAERLQQLQARKGAEKQETPATL